MPSMGTEEHPMSDTTLMGKIEEKVTAAVAAKGVTVDDTLKLSIRESIADAITEYRDASADRAVYETALGGFIIDQVPYATWEHLDFPNLPIGPTGENQWVRRSGVLSEYNTLHPLPG